MYFKSQLIDKNSFKQFCLLLKNTEKVYSQCDLLLLVSTMNSFSHIFCKRRNFHLYLEITPSIYTFASIACS